MKLIFILVLLISATYILSSTHLNKPEKKSKTSPVAKKHTPKAKVKAKRAENPIKTIPFGPAATKVHSNLNSLGQTVKKSVALNKFPFKITRCDQIVLFPATYINDEDDFRVRRKGFVAITAHYTNLFADEDGQRLIQQTVSSTMRSQPHDLKGARGCIRIPGGLRQKNLNICATSVGNARNLLNVYSDFSRCRIGDNLAPVKAAVLKKLMKSCGINRASLSGAGSDKAMGKLKSALGGKNARKLAKSKKKKDPNVFLPINSNNPWEKDRKSYVQYSKLKVPGTRR
jgi:hypothetical protein